MADMAQQQAVFSRYFSQQGGATASGPDSSELPEGVSAEQHVFARYFLATGDAANDPVVDTSVDIPAVTPEIPAADSAPVDIG